MSGANASIFITTQEYLGVTSSSVIFLKDVYLLSVL